MTTAAHPLTPEALRQVAVDFRRDGYAHLAGVLDLDLVAALRRRTDELLDDPQLRARECPELSDARYVQTQRTASGEEVPFILRNTIALDGLFVRLLTHPVVLGLAEAVLGAGCRFCGQNVLRSGPGVAIDRWHVDDAVFFPVPEGVARHDPRIPPPVLWLTVQIPLSDVETQADGPTQYVPGSQASGRRPDPVQTPAFEGRGPVSVLCRAGDLYLHDPQCWHRGAPNTSGRVRYLLQCQFGVEWAWRRFGWMNRVPVRDADLADASDALLRVLGVQRPKAVGQPACPAHPLPHGPRP